MPGSSIRRTLPCVFAAIVALALILAGCFDPPPKPYGVEHALELPGATAQIWAVAPAVNLSGHREVDALLQADLLFQQVQSVKGLTAVPVNRVVQAYQALNIDRIRSRDQAAAVCDLLQVDGLIVPTVTAYDPYIPPKMGGSLALFLRSKDSVQLRQATGIYDAATGSVRTSMLRFADGRSDPNGPMAEREYFLSMDRYSGFCYHELIADLLGVPSEPAPATRTTSDDFSDLTHLLYR